MNGEHKKIAPVKGAILNKICLDKAARASKAAEASKAAKAAKATYSLEMVITLE